MRYSWPLRLSDHAAEIWRREKLENSHHLWLGIRRFHSKQIYFDHPLPAPNPTSVPADIALEHWLFEHLLRDSKMINHFVIAAADKFIEPDANNADYGDCSWHDFSASVEVACDLPPR